MYEDEIPVGKAKDLRGKTYNRLTVLYRVQNNANKNVKWKCQCECGNIITVESSQLVSGKTKSCGCYKASINKKNLIGQKFGRLTVIKDSGQRNNDRQIMWECKCECGNITLVATKYLTSEKTQSCGCIKTVDLTGQRFGKLIAIRPTEKRSGRSIVWECKCECGNLAYISTRNLRCGDTNSCGCLTSKGETAIASILQHNNIVHEVQKTFETCRLPDTNSKARFDFFINNHYLIEFDGSQHFFANEHFWNTEKNFQKTQERDKYKNQWCKDNNIPLIRIPYTKLDTLCIEDLLLETTQFRVI